MEIYKEFAFDAAHRLPNVPNGHPCGREHGHSYHVAVHIRGPVGMESGWVVDFGHIMEVVRPIIAELDHRCLNDVAGLDNPTSENLAIWLWRRVEGHLPGLCKVIVKESSTSGCIYEGEGS